MSNSLLKNKGAVITLIGIVVMTVLIVVKMFMPESVFSGYAMIFGIAVFFIVESVEKTPDDESGIRFSTIITDLRKPQVLFWVLLPVFITIMQMVCGKLFCEASYRKYIEHVIGRTSLEMDFSNSIKWIGISMITVLGEEIAFRGFLLGKGKKVLPAWICMIGSAILFALGHMATGNTAIVLFDLFGIFVDAIMFAIAYNKSENCIISYIPHCLNNILGLLLVRALFM